MVALLAAPKAERPVVPACGDTSPSPLWCPAARCARGRVDSGEVKGGRRKARSGAQGTLVLLSSDSRGSPPSNSG